MKLPDDIREFFRRQGKIGARKRVQVLSAERRQEIARHAANARWANRKDQEAAKNDAAAKRREPK